MPPKPKFPDEIEQEITHRHLAGERIYLLAREYNVWPSRIRAAIERHGGQFVDFDYQFNEQAFDDLTSEVACYWLGFIFADGYVNEQGLRINIKRSDENHLVKLKTFLHAEQPIGHDVSRAKGKDHLRAHLMIADRRFAQRLIDIGISKDRPNPMRCALAVPEHLRHHWFRGLFDGDGCAHSEGRLTFLAPEPLLIFLKSELLKQSIIANRPSFPNGPKISSLNSGKIHRLSFGGIAQCRLIANYLYADAAVWLERKRAIIDSWTSHSYLRAGLGS